MQLESNETLELDEKLEATISVSESIHGLEKAMK